MEMFKHHRVGFCLVVMSENLAFIYLFVCLVFFLTRKLFLRFISSGLPYDLRPQGSKSHIRRNYLVEVKKKKR